MGHKAFKTPSRAAVAMHRALNPQYPAANAAVTANAITQALCPAIFKPLSAAISQIIGSIASKNSNSNNCFPTFLNWIIQFIDFIYFSLRFTLFRYS